MHIRKDLFDCREHFEESLKEISDRFFGAMDKLQTKTKRLSKICEETAVYEKWTVKETMLWINSLEHGRFIKYHDSLKSTFIDQKIGGADLVNLDTHCVCY